VRGSEGEREEATEMAVSMCVSVCARVCDLGIDICDITRSKSNMREMR